MPSARRNLGLILAALLVPAAAAPAGDDGNGGADREAIDRSLELLGVQMKLRVLQTYHERCQFFVPRARSDAHVKKHKELSEAMGKGAPAPLTGADSWVEEVRKVHVTQAEEMLKLAEKYVPQLLAAAKDKVEERQFALKAEEWRQQPRKKALEIARYVEGLAGRLQQLNREDPGQFPQLAEWRQSVKNLYVGAIGDTDNLITLIAGYERERLRLDGWLSTIKQIDDGFSLYKDIKEQPLATAFKLAEEKAQEKVLQHLKDNYTDVAEDEIKSAWKTVKDDLGQAWEVFKSHQSLDEDADLRGNPAALQAAKRFVVLGGLYNYTLGKFKDSPAFKALGPLGDFLDYYGQAINLLPEIARKMTALVNRVDQSYRGVRVGDAYNVVKLADGGGPLHQLDDLLGRFGLQIAYDSAIDPSVPTARYYMLVDKAVVPRGYASFTREQFERMMQAIADERFLNAPGEAGRGPLEWFTENLWELANLQTRPTNVLSANASDGYLNDLKERAKKSPLTKKPQDLLDLAFGQPIDFNGAQWTAQKFRERAEQELESRADEMTVREALGQYRFSFKQEWWQFRDLLRQQAPALNPRQILNLFNHYHHQGAGRVRAYLQRVAAERAAHRRGTPKVGVVLIDSRPRVPALTPGSSARLSADLIVANLAPERKVPAEVVWKLADKTSVRQQVELKNGLVQAEQAITVPTGLKGGRLDVHVTVRVPVEPGWEAVAEAVALLKAGKDVPPVQVVAKKDPDPKKNDPDPKKESDPKKPGERPGDPRIEEVTGAARFDVEKPGALQLAFRRSKSGLFVLEVTSAALNDLDLKDKKRTLQYTLYRAEAREGPFKPVQPTFRASSLGQADLERGVIGRLAEAKDKIILADDTILNAPEKPFHYQVGECWVDILPSGGVKEGVETRSPILSPSLKAVLLLAGEVEEPAQVRQLDQGAAQVSLAYSEQLCRVPGAAFQVSAGSWQGFVWSGRREGDKLFSRAGVGNAVINVPVPPEGVSISISAQGGSLSASRTIQVKADPQKVRYKQEETQRINKILENLPKDYAKTSQRLQNEVKIWGAKLGQIDKKDVQGYARAFKIHHSSVRELKYQDEVEAPRNLNSWKRSLAEAGGDFSAVLASRLEELKFAERGRAIWLEWAEKLDAGNQQLAGVPKLSTSEAEALARDQKEVERIRKPEDFLQQLRGIHQDIADAARQAGNAGHFVTGQTEALRLLSELDPKSEKLPGWLYHAADGLALLSGNRGEAANLFLRGRALHLQLADPKDREGLRQRLEEEPLPAWWPAGKMSGPPQGEDWRSFRDRVLKSLKK